MANLFTSCKDIRAQVNKNISKIQALESTVVIPYKILSSETKYPQTLNVTEPRQYRTQELIHVSDKYYEFVLELEQKRIQGLSTTMLKKLGDQDEIAYFKTSLRHVVYGRHTL